MYWCPNCAEEVQREICDSCGAQAEELKPEEMERAAPYWKAGVSNQADGPVWPLEADGEREAPALLTGTRDSAGDVGMLAGMLQAFGIPVLCRYPHDGSFGRVMLGFSGYGADLYVPQSRLEEARELLGAPALEEDE